MTRLILSVAALLLAVSGYDMGSKPRYRRDTALSWT
jgi:hypothetical protein